MKEKERRIKEARTLEAQKKKYMGLEGKLGTIAKALGDELIYETEGGGTRLGFGHGIRSLDDIWGPVDDETAEEMATAYYEEINQPDTEEWAGPRDYDLYTPELIGWRFDGLSRGMHLEILYLRRGKKLTVNYKGYKVYEEKDGDLKCFNPFSDWESMIDRLAPVAKEKTIKSRREIIEEERAKGAKDQANWIKEMRLKWGL